VTHSEELPAAERRVLLPGLVVGECSGWHDDRLWFSDMWARQVIAVDLRGRSEVVADVPTVGMAFDP
jgi:sugar lactone lactonase YvrE